MAQTTTMRPPNLPVLPSSDVSFTQDVGEIHLGLRSAFFFCGISFPSAFLLSPKSKFPFLLNRNRLLLCDNFKVMRARFSAIFPLSDI